MTRCCRRSILLYRCANMPRKAGATLSIPCRSLSLSLSLSLVLPFSPSLSLCLSLSLYLFVCLSLPLSVCLSLYTHIYTHILYAGHCAQIGPFGVSRPSVPIRGHSCAVFFCQVGRFSALGRLGPISGGPLTELEDHNF